MVEVRFKVILVYLFVLVAPFFMFAIAADKDSLPMWMMGLLILVFLYDFLLRDGQFWIDRSFLFVFRQEFFSARGREQRALKAASQLRSD